MAGAMTRYDPATIEPKWQAFWEKDDTFRTPEGSERPKTYILDMFPYPSGAGLHVGHPEGYTATDIMARYRRASGCDVLHPMGWDAFGLPAEQHAIVTGTHPRDTTAQNIATFKRQLKMLGFSYDWAREIDTTSPEYVKWTQWIFLKLFKRGLAYQSEVAVNWCGELGTVLANEEVINGLSERGGHSVERVPLRQWVLKITAYADRLLEDLEGVEWPNSTRIMQQEWVGRSEGAEVKFDVAGHDAVIEVFTTRPDTLFGATFMVLAPEHPLVEMLTTDERRGEITAYVEQAKNKSERDRQASKEKTGVFTGGFAINPVNGAEVPVYIADYVLWGYGTGAIMAVPAHDVRDFEFATAHGIPIIEVVSKTGASADAPLSEAMVEHGVGVNSGKYDGLQTAEFKKRVTADLEAAGQGSARVEYKLRDWVFSRQRYWGEPIPIYFPVETEGDPRAGADYTIRYDQPIAVDERELPLRLPELDDYKPGADPAGVLARAEGWRFFQKNGQWFARETNTMPQWAGSCWYYLRFIDPDNAEALCSPDLAKQWLPVDLYVGGAEHAVLHLLYARFWHKVLYDEGVVPTKEPFKKLVHQGMILGEGGQKMSKSRGNVVNPDDIVAEFGADAMRIYEMFMGPLEATKPWSTSSIAGVRRFLDRVFAVTLRANADAKPDDALTRLLHQTIRKVTEDIEAMRFNTAISAMMVLTNELMKLDEVPTEALGVLAKLLHPFAPHLGEESWAMLGQPPSIQTQAWPSYDPALCEQDEVEVPVQINGKVRARITLPKDATEAQALTAAQTLPALAPHLKGKPLRKTIWVPNKILNLIL
ncbi:MAG: leucine--tRNA ligase [Deltaproteobacteria bacterium]|nr:leucine--tRNA ligase [Deltaproteobacteria bacterium]